MTENQTHETQDAVKHVIDGDATSSMFERLINDPMASAGVAAAMTAVAFSFVLSGIWIVSAAIG